MSRRRLSPLARCAMQVAHDINPDRLAARFVFASRHGEIQNTLAMLRSLAQSEPLSPAIFSHAVHNAIPGLWSIQHQQTTECSAIAAGKDTLAMAFIEAAGLLADDASTPVILVMADEVVPAVFGADASEANIPFALAVMLTTGTANCHLTAYSGLNAEPIQNPALQWLNWWQSPSDFLIQNGERQQWHWTRA